MIHKEGHKIIAIEFVLLLSINLVIYFFVTKNPIITYSLITISLLFWLFVIRFFRKPKRDILVDENKIYAPADGKVMVIEEIEETEFLNEKRIQVSVFMSVWNVHINWFPIQGVVKYFKYHPGKFLIASLPKSSTDNERTTVVVEDKNKRQLLLRQIAGFVARRIISYAPKGKNVEQNSEMGFIRFGSRVDIMLPLDAKIEVHLGQKVKGTQTVIATFE